MISRMMTGVALCLVLTACSDPVPAPSPAANFSGIDLTGAEWGRDIRLADHNGRQRSLGDFKGKVVLLFFGYLSCPDMCPTTVSEMAQVRARMGANSERVQGLFVTVDPKRDKPEILSQYLASFDPTFLGLWGDEAATAAAAGEFKVFFKAQQPGPRGSYTVDHMGGVYVLDARGRLRLMLRPGASVDAMAADVAQLLKESI